MVAFLTLNGTYAGYALQWQAILKSKSWQCNEYDLYGFVLPAEINNPYARFFSRFKQQFAGRHVRTIDLA